MANIFDYIKWRGDISMESNPFNDVDFLILCRMAYAPFDGVVPSDMIARTPLGESADAVRKLARDESDGRKYHMDIDDELLKALSESNRFKSLMLSGFVNLFSPDMDEQFSAITVYLPDGSAAAVFRGTDGTLTGWKEDFNMALKDKVPAQRDAVNYVSELAKCFGGYMRLGGHSKGGNLAMYASAFADEKYAKRIVQTRNFDGPGFNDATMELGNIERAARFSKTYLPQSSIVGMLLGHAEGYTVIKSASKMAFQHDIYTWMVMGAGFITLEERTGGSQFIDSTLKAWLKEMPDELCGKMVDGLFKIVFATGANSAKELRNKRSIMNALKAYSSLDDDTKAVLQEALKILTRSAKDSLPVLLERMSSPDDDEPVEPERLDKQMITQSIMRGIKKIKGQID